jgi:hypothetical protein
MGEHIDTRATQKRKKLKEHDTNARHARITFKRYLRDLEEELLEIEAEAADPVLADKDSSQDE